MDRVALLDSLDAPPVFVIGSAQSGANWVYEVLVSQPKVAGVRESWMFHDPAGELSRTRDLRSWSAARLSQALAPEDRYLVEKSSSHVFALSAIADAWPEARFVHVLRDGRDVAVAVDAVAHDWPASWGELFGNSIAEAARGWATSVQIVEDAKRAMRDRLVEVRYENIFEDPWRVALRLFDRLDITCDEEALLEAFEAEEGRLRRVPPPGAWKRRFNLVRAYAFHRAATPALVQTGYESDRSWWFSPIRRS